jgi:hypothetical protein
MATWRPSLSLVRAPAAAGRIGCRDGGQFSVAASQQKAASSRAHAIATVPVG